MTAVQNSAMVPAMTNQPFFTKDGDAFIPTQVANGPWNPNSMHGRVVIGLLAHVIEQRHGSDDFVPARLTVDMFRLPNIQTPVEVTTRLVRDGNRIRVVEAEFLSGGTSMARASCQLLRKTENAPGNVWSPPNWDAPRPADIPAPTDPRLGMNGKWTTRPIVGAMGSLGPRRLWMSEVRELVEGVPMSPFVQVATGADFASPFANAGDQGLGYINSDVTLYLHRLPVTRWIGFEVVNHHASDGIAIGECWLYDEQGPIGTSTVAALAQRKPMTNWRRRRRARSPSAVIARSSCDEAIHSFFSPHDGLLRFARNDGEWHHTRCRFISGRAFSAAPCLATIFAIRSGAKFMSTKPVAVLATS